MFLYICDNYKDPLRVKRKGHRTHPTEGDGLRRARRRGENVTICGKYNVFKDRGHRDSET